MTLTEKVRQLMTSQEIKEENAIQIMERMKALHGIDDVTPQVFSNILRTLGKKGEVVLSRGLNKRNAIITLYTSPGAKIDLPRYLPMLLSQVRN